MSFRTSDTKMKTFITEEEANEIKVKRQAEWEKVRRPEDPLERPEEEPRSLFEQLQAQKEKAQQEHDEKYCLKNMFRGIDNDEAAFLDFASQQQAEIDRRRYAVTTEVQEYRNEVAQLQAAIAPDSVSNLKEKKKPCLTQSNKKSQMELLSGVIKTKRKRSETENTEPPEVKTKDDADHEATCIDVETDGGAKKPRQSEKGDDALELGTAELSRSSEQYLTADSESSNIAAYYPSSIPSLGIYTDSSDSESSSSDSDILPSLFSFSSTSKQK